MSKIYSFIEEKISDKLYNIHFNDYLIEVVNVKSDFPWRVNIYKNNIELQEALQMKTEFKTFHAAKNGIAHHFRIQILNEEFVIEYKKRDSIICECGKNKFKFSNHAFWCPKWESY